VREKEDRLADVTAHVPAIPEWFFQRLTSVYGRDEARKIADAQVQPAAIDLTVKSDPAGWAERLNGIVLPTGSVRLRAFQGSLPELPGFDEGEWWVQDAAASIPARLFGNVKGKRIADLCAAPGGKTAQLLLAGAEVTALDQSATRLKRLNSNLDRLKFRAETILANAAHWQPDNLFDAVLLDAPCSSTGTIRRHPDVLYTKGPDDISKLAQVQDNLLRHALTLVKPGGLVVFSNCSLDPIEGEDLVARLLSETGSVERVPINPQDWPGLENAITSLGEFRTTPAMIAPSGTVAGGMDGFFACVLRRVDGNGAH
jgi:16S rRNA (cytosine967-C5)-methyltransferase